MEDLWKIYKAAKQRFNRSNNIDQKHFAEKSVEAIKIVLENPTVENALKFASAEQEYLNHWSTKTSVVSYSGRVVDSIRNNNFTSSKPKLNLPGFGDHPAEGFIYIATSDTRLSQIKIGYTTLPLKKRMQLYRTRYQYLIKPEAYAWVQNPAKIEKILQEKLKELRVCGLENGDSNEWYQCNIQMVTCFIDIIADEHDLIITSKTWC